MKLTILKPFVIEVDAIRCVLPVRYEEEDMPYDFPHRVGDVWEIWIDIETGQIRDWPTGQEPYSLCMKVCDSGSYYLMHGQEEIEAIEEDYVPNCIPGDYGDYVKFEIDASGRITNWETDAAEIMESFGYSTDED